VKTCWHLGPNGTGPEPLPAKAEPPPLSSPRGSITGVPRLFHMHHSAPPLPAQRHLGKLGAVLYWTPMKESLVVMPMVLCTPLRVVGLRSPWWYWSRNEREVLAGPGSTCDPCNLECHQLWFANSLPTPTACPTLGSLLCTNTDFMCDWQGTAVPSFLGFPFYGFRLPAVIYTPKH
jgi:hypothetical protein